MRFFSIIMLAILSVGCSDRFNWHDRLSEKPTEAEVAGTYRLVKTNAAAAPLIEMGYTSIDSSVELRPDGTFTATKLPGCCLHGWDERPYPFTGGLYSMSGKWSIVKTEAVYDVELKIDTVTEHTNLKIDNPELASERRPRSSRKVSIIRGSPIDLGFDVFDGDFWSIRFIRTAQKNQTAEQ